MRVEPLLSKWEVKKLEELSSAIQYGYTAKATTERIGPKLLRITDIQNDAVDWDAVPFCEISAKEIEKYRLGKNDLLFARTGATVGKSYLIAGSIPKSVFASYLIRVRLLETVYPKYVAYFFRSGDYWRQITENQAGIGRPNVNGTKLAQIKIPVAPLSQQGLIVAEIEKQFSRLDEAIANLKRVKANLKRYKASVLKSAVEGKLTEDWRKQHPNVEPATKLLERILAERREQWNGKGKYKEPSAPETSILPTLPEGWIWTNVDQLAEVGTGATPRRGKAQYYSGGHIPWVTSSALNKEFVDKADECVTDTALQETNLTLYPPGTLLLAMYGEGRTRGKCSELHIHATTNQAIAAIQCSGKGRDYLKLAIWNQYEDLRRTASGGVQPNLNLSLVRSITIPFPPLVEQQHIVAEVERRLSVIEELEATVKANLTRADRLRQSILSQAFSGKLSTVDAKGNDQRSTDIDRARA